jgi:hypothetical protein
MERVDGKDKLPVEGKSIKTNPRYFFSGRFF